MFLSWLKVNVQTVPDLLWYLDVSPPPQKYPTVMQKSVSGNAQSVRPAENSARRPSPPPEVTAIKSPPPSLFALIIGINKYKDPAVRDLHGAVADADAVENFLTSKVGVPENRIVNLRDEEATREAMVNAIQNLAHNPAISPQDPIFIFYAGHGAEARPPHTDSQTSSANGMIQMLSPHDFISKGSNGPRGQGIPDATLSRLLVDIAKNKSDNITVIFDCCHSCPDTRDMVHDKTLAVRSITLPRNYTIHADAFGSRERTSSMAFALDKSVPRSHVLLAACTQGQTAKERQGHGAFTPALLGLLQRDGIDQLTYKDIIIRMPDLPHQNPQCEGVNQNRVLFHSKVTSLHRNSYRISGRPGKYILEAGETHGVTNKAEFAVYSDKKMSFLVGHVVACRTTPFQTQCSVTVGGTLFSLSQPGYAVQTRVGEGQDLNLYIEPNNAFLGLFMRMGKHMHRTDVDKRSFRLLDSASEADLAIGTHNGQVQFHVMQKICRQYGLTRMPFDDIRADESEYLFSILHSAADFYWNLHHSNKRNSNLTQKIIVECFKLVPSRIRTGASANTLIPEPGGQNLNIGGTITIVDEHANYGYKIKNTSSVPLYAALFYFDVSRLTIEQYYSPGVGRVAANGNFAFSLPAGGHLTIGFGDSGTLPHSYSLSTGQSVDIGFLKLYISTDYVDYSGIAQESPFQRERASAPTQPKRRYLWDTVTIPIIRRKGMASDQGLGFGSGFGGSLHLSAEFGGSLHFNAEFGGLHFSAEIGGSPSELLGPSFGGRPGVGPPNEGSGPRSSGGLGETPGAPHAGGPGAYLGARGGGSSGGRTGSGYSGHGGNPDKDPGTRSGENPDEYLGAGSASPDGDSSTRYGGNVSEYSGGYAGSPDDDAPGTESESRFGGFGAKYNERPDDDSGAGCGGSRDEYSGPRSLDNEDTDTEPESRLGGFGAEYNEGPNDDFRARGGGNRDEYSGTRSLDNEDTDIEPESHLGGFITEYNEGPDDDSGARFGGNRDEYSGTSLDNEDADTEPESRVGGFGAEYNEGPNDDSGARFGGNRDEYSGTRSLDNEDTDTEPESRLGGFGAEYNEGPNDDSGARFGGNRDEYSGARSLDNEDTDTEPESRVGGFGAEYNEGPNGDSGARFGGNRDVYSGARSLDNEDTDTEPESRLGGFGGVYNGGRNDDSGAGENRDEYSGTRSPDDKDTHVEPESHFGGFGAEYNERPGYGSGAGQSGSHTDDSGARYDGEDPGARCERGPRGSFGEGRESPNGDSGGRGGSGNGDFNAGSFGEDPGAGDGEGSGGPYGDFGEGRESPNGDSGGRGGSGNGDFNAGSFGEDPGAGDGEGSGGPYGDFGGGREGLDGDSGAEYSGSRNDGSGTGYDAGPSDGTDTGPEGPYGDFEADAW